MHSSYIRYPIIAKPKPAELDFSCWNSPTTKFCSFSTSLLRRIMDYKEQIYALKQLQKKQLGEASSSGSSKIMVQINVLSNCLRSQQKGIVQSIDELKNLCDIHDKDQVCQVNNMNRNFKNAIRDLMVANSDYQHSIRDNSVKQYMCLNPKVSEAEALDFVETLNGQHVSVITMKGPKSKAVQTYEGVSARYKELKELEKSAAELNHLVDSLHNITVTQDTQFQVINENLNRSSLDLERGDANVLSSISRSRKSKLMGSWLFVIVVFIALLMIGSVVGGLVKWCIL